MGQMEIHRPDAVVPAKLAETQRPGAAGAPAPPDNSILQRMLAEAAAGRYEQALQISQGKGEVDLDVANARGVCMLRLGRYEDAIRLYRGLVLHAGGTWMRPDRPVHYKINFATALLLGGHPSGCLEMLGELGKNAPPAAGELKATIKAWQATLPFWARLNWKIGQVEPTGRPVAIDFEPGDFGFALPSPPASPASETQTARRSKSNRGTT